jgi:hypothetical protein
MVVAGTGLAAAGGVGSAMVMVEGMALTMAGFPGM